MPRTIMTRTHPTGTDAIPRWITALDVLCLVLLLMMLRAILGEGYRISLPGDLRISLRSWPRLAVWLAVLLSVRHLARHNPSWPARVMAWFRPAWQWEPLRAAWPPYVVSRCLALIAGYVSVVNMDPSLRPPTRALNNEVLNLYARFDAFWYTAIASRGYDVGLPFDPMRQSEIAFFPGLPLLMRGASVILDVDLWTAGIVIVTVAFLWALTYVYRLARLDLEPAEARASLACLAFYPFAICYSAVFTEALFLLCAAASFYHFRRDQYWKAGGFSLFLGLLRPNGFLVSIPLALMALLPFARSRGLLPGSRATDGESWRRLSIRLTVSTLPVLGMLLYAGHVWTLTGNPFSFVEAQQAWGRRSVVIDDVIAHRATMIAHQGAAAYARYYSVEIMEGAAALFALVAVWPISRRFGVAYGLFVAMAVLPPLISMGTVSLGRYTAPLFPIFLWLGASVPADRRPYWFAGFAAGEALVASLFYTVRPPF